MKFAEKLVIKAYNSPDIKIPKDWKSKVMRELKPFEQMDIVYVLSHFIWRFSAVACVIILFLSIYALQINFSPEYEVVKSFVENPLDMLINQYLNI